MWVIAVGLPASGRCHQNELELCGEFNVRIVQFYLLTTQTILSHACSQYTKISRKLVCVIRVMGYWDTV